MKRERRKRVRRKNLEYERMALTAELTGMEKKLWGLMDLIGDIRTKIAHVDIKAERLKAAGEVQ